MILRKCANIESLEERRLLSGTPWGAQGKLIGQDLVAAQFPQLTGAGETVAVIGAAVNAAQAAERC